MMFCLHSTDESIQNEQISILAIFEIFISIAIYWGIASYFDYYYHIYFSLAVAPLFLLRTKKSEQEALEFFTNFINNNEKSFANYLFISFLLLCASVLIAFITYYTVSFLTINYQGFDLLWRIFVFGIGVECVIMGAVGIAVGVGITLGIAILGVGIGTFGVIGILGVAGVLVIEIALTVVVGMVVAVVGVAGVSALRVVVIVGVSTPIFIFAISLIKIFFTLKNIFDGFKQIPYNWNKLIVYQDMYSQAEVIPGINKYNGMNDFKFMHLKNDIIDSKYGIEDRIMHTLLLVILYTTTIIYRISLKSTSLFYWILFINPFGIYKGYDNKRMKEIITKEQNIYLWFPIIMMSIFLSLNIGFFSIDSLVEYIQGALFYPSVKYFLTYFIFSSIICGLIWFIAKMFLISDEDSNEGFYRMLLNGLLKILKLSMGISIILYMHYIYNLLNVFDVAKIVFEYYTNFSIL